MRFFFGFGLCIGPQSTYRDRVEKGCFYLSAGAYTTTLYVMVDIVKGGGRAPPTSPPESEFMTFKFFEVSGNNLESSQT